MITDLRSYYVCAHSQLRRRWEVYRIRGALGADGNVYLPVPHSVLQNRAHVPLETLADTRTAAICDARSRLHVALGNADAEMFQEINELLHTLSTFEAEVANEAAK